MKLQVFQVDAFTKEVFKGNPAAVCKLDNWVEKSLMQDIAAENNEAETAFFVERNGFYEMRWFTPQIEVDLCGHASLATAHVIFNYYNEANKDILIFQTMSGELIARKNDDNGTIILDLPTRKAEKIECPADITTAIGYEPDEVWVARDYMIVLDSETAVKEIQPDLDIVKVMDCTGLIVTAKGNDVDFVSRFFAPQAGIPEDYVTGSAHCTLVPYWAQKLNKNSFHAIQLSKRGGELFCELWEDRVFIGGYAKTYLIGMISV